MVLPAFVWPHVAYLITRHSQDPYRAEARNLLVDSAMAASFVPLIHFNLLPSVLLVTLTMVDKITTGIRGLWARSVPAMLGGGWWARCWRACTGRPTPPCASSWPACP